MGNISQPGNLTNPDVNGNEDPPNCRAAIKSFQYGWGGVDQGNRCMITVVDEAGGEFDAWIKSVVKSDEGASTPGVGQYRMVVQFGWYVEGGAPDDVCGQPTAPPNTQPEDGENHSYQICSPLMYFMPFLIHAKYEGSKFIYDLEGADTLIRSQRNNINKTLGNDGTDINASFRGQMYFVEACHRLGQIAQPPFRVEFLTRDKDGTLKRMKFIKRPGNAMDDECWGPYDVWTTYERPPLAIIHEWIRSHGVFAQNIRGDVPDKLGIVLNFDPTYRWNNQDAQCVTSPCDPPVNAECNNPDFVGPVSVGCTPTEFCECLPSLPQYGKLILWAGGIPYGTGNIDEFTINNNMKAVYLVNAGRCSPVLSFNPVFSPIPFVPKAGTPQGIPAGTQLQQSAALVAGGIAIAASRGPTRVEASPWSGLALKVRNPNLLQGQAVIHQTMANLLVYGLEAELRVQGDPSDWLCTPAEGFVRTVGIIFINPQFLTDLGGDCPEWSSVDTQNNTICNNILTNRCWYIKGVDHQIRDGNYITTIKLALPVPGNELTDAGSVVNLGGDPQGGSIPRGGTFAPSDTYPLGSLAADWGEQTTDCPIENRCLQCAVFTGGGEACNPALDTDCYLGV